jgi:hypothetical protein
VAAQASGGHEMVKVPPPPQQLPPNVEHVAKKQSIQCLVCARGRTSSLLLRVSTIRRELGSLCITV